MIVAAAWVGLQTSGEIIAVYIDLVDDIILWIFAAEIK